MKPVLENARLLVAVSECIVEIQESLRLHRELLEDLQGRIERLEKEAKR